AGGGAVELARRPAVGGLRGLAVAGLHGRVEALERGLDRAARGLVAQPPPLVLPVALDLAGDVGHCGTTPRCRWMSWMSCWRRGPRRALRGTRVQWKQDDLQARRRAWHRSVARGKRHGDAGPPTVSIVTTPSEQDPVAG